MSDTPTREIPDFAKMKPEELPVEFTLFLLKPIRFGKGDNVEIHSRIDLREPTLDEIDEFVKNVRKRGEIEALKFLISKVSGEEFPIIGLMGARDMTAAQEYLMAFFNGSHATGDTSPE